MDYKKLLKKGVKVLGIGLIGATIVLASCTQKFTEEEVNERVNLAVEEAQAQTAEQNAEALINAEAFWRAELERVQAEASTSAGSEDILPEPIVYHEDALNVPVCSSNSEDGLALGSVLEFTFDDSDFCVLNEGEVEFGDEDFDYRELIVLTSDVRIGHSGDAEFDEDFGSEPRLVLLSRSSVQYVYEFEEVPEWSEVSEDDDIEIVFAGQQIRIVGADDADDSITISVAKALWMNEGTTDSVSGLTLLAVGEDEVMVSYGGDTYTIEEGSSTRFSDGVRGRLGFVDHRDDPGASRALIRIGEFASKTIDNGDEFIGEEEDNPVWRFDFDLSEGRLAIEHDESLTEEDEALRLGEALVLPNNLGKIFLEVDEDGGDREDYTFDFETNDIGDSPVNVLVMNGKFEYDGFSDANEIAFNGTALFAEEEGEWVEVEDVVFEVNGNELSIPSDNTLAFDDVVLEVDLDDRSWVGITYASESLTAREEDVLTVQGYVIENPDNAFNDGERGRELRIRGVPEDPVEYRLVLASVEQE